MIGQTTRFIIFLFMVLTLSCSPKTAQIMTGPLPLTEIQDIRVVQAPEGAEVVIEGQQPMIYTTFHLTDPDRLVVDIAGMSLGRFTDKILVDQGPIRSILPKVGEGIQVSRLEIELNGPAETNVRTEGTNLIVEATPLKPDHEQEAEGLVENQETMLPSAEPNPILPAPVKEEKNFPPAKNVSDIRFDHQENLQLVVTSDGQLSPEAFLLDKGRLVIDLPNVKSAIKVKSIPAEDRSVKQVRIGQHPDKLRLVLDLLLPVVYSLEQHENQLRIHIQDASKALTLSEKESPSDLPFLASATVAPSLAVPVVPPAIPPVAEAVPSQKEEVIPPPANESSPAKVAEEKTLPKEAAPPEPSKTEPPSVKPMPGAIADRMDIVVENKKAPDHRDKKEKNELIAPPKFVGKKVSLDFQDADITNVIRLIADVSNLNIVLGEDVKGKVTMKLVNVPWDQALDIILKMNNLGQIRDGNIIRVATLANIAKQQDEEAKAKETKIRAEDLQTRIIYVNYGKAKELAEPLKKVLSTRGDITIDERTNTLIIKDIEKNIEEIARLVKTLDTQTPQVIIEARIVQVAPTFNRSLGIQWGASYRDISNGNIIGLTNAVQGPIQGVGPGSISPFGTPLPDFAVNLPAASNFGGIGFTFGRFTDNPINLDLRLSAGESKGLTRIVSTPKISVLDNQEAKIEQGESIPFATTSQQGTQTTFIDANLTLLVTPHISSDGGVMMKIKVAKNAPGETRQGASGPSILKKEATTNVLVRDGETTVIGGIFETTKTDSVSGIPFLMDIPVLGWLFKTTTKREDTSELLVFLTPRVVR